MRIGLVLPGFCSNEHDWCIPALYNFVRTLAHDTQVCVFPLEYPYRQRSYDFFGAQVFSLGGGHRGKAYVPRLWSRTLAAIFAEHRRARFDALHAFWANKSGFFALTIGRALHIPVIASVAGGELVGYSSIKYGGQLGRIERPITNWVMKGADRVTVGTRYLQGVASRWRKDTRIAPLGIDAEMFSPACSDRLDGTPNVNARADTSSIHVINVASCLAVKQQEILLEAFSHLKSNAELDIIGAGDRLSSLQRRAAELGIAARVRFSGELDHGALPDKYRAADVLVQSSLHEAQGMAVLEAAACGVAIAGTPVGVLPELVETGAAIASTGFDAQSLASAIDLANQSRCELGLDARKRAETDFSLPSTRSRWMSLYSTLT